MACKVAANAWSVIWSQASSSSSHQTPRWWTRLVTWLVRGTANTGSEGNAKLVALVLRFALVAWMRGQKLSDLGERLKSVTVMPEGSQVKLAGLALTDEEIGPIFLSLVAGSPPQDGSAP